MGVRSLLYGLYERQLGAELRGATLPRHIGVILDGNRRWAKTIGAPAAHGHQKGADKITEVLEWSQEAGVEVVTLWLLSTDNLDRDPAELEPLLEIICSAVENLAHDGRWRLRHVGDASLLPASSADRISAAVARTEDATGVHVNIAIGYGGRHEITDAVRSYLRECDEEGLTLSEAADRLKVDHIEGHLYTKGQPDPDLVIRTSGEQRLSGFLMWQSAHTEFYFCEVYWPAFRRVDFLRALRDYALRERRLGR